ncbi:hypothetical protein [Bradyrhizobium arachidis]|uniref:hypothetical protein n=1 Tax=Bradyrhizobium arachidis TaxID=858423 RepID=UPI0021620C85|nr:hypothetical protein [Bradyrhizobium arachidis]UVO30169.1 hypothetical protein KUF59_05220 [Bradyrhizobium arachidis]
MLHQQNEVRVKIEDGGLVLVQTDCYGEEAKFFVHCTYIDNFIDILTWALEDYAAQRASRYTAPAPPTQPTDASGTAAEAVLRSNRRRTRAPLQGAQGGSRYGSDRNRKHRNRN